MSANFLALEAIATHLEDNIRDEDFDMSCWKCGCFGCAIGHSMNLPEVESTGLRKGGLPTFIIPLFKDFSHMLAISKAFELSEEDTDYLFHIKSYINPTKNNVIERLRTYCHLKGKENAH